MSIYDYLCTKNSKNTANMGSDPHDLRALILIFEKCNKKIQEAQQQIREDKKLQEVCHFTDLNALYSMLGYCSMNKKEKGTDDGEKNVLRAYNAIYMNDPSEGKALVEYSHRRNNTDKEIPDLTDFFKDAEHKWIDHDAAKSIYSISFTADNDSLTLWRAYGRDGYGVCIVIPVRTLKQSEGDNLIGANYFQKLKNGHFETVEIQYPTIIGKDNLQEKSSINITKKRLKDPAEPNEAISENLFKVQYIGLDGKNNPDEKVADDLLKSLKESLDEINRMKRKYKDAEEEINKATREAFAGALYLFKDAQYESEHEYRMLEMRPLNDENIEMDEQFPPRLFLETRPFVFEDPATKLIIGPAVENPENVKLSVEHILTKKDHFSKEIKVEFSKVNYRPAKK